MGPSGSSLRNAKAASLATGRGTNVPAPAQVELAASAGDPDEKKPPLFLELVAIFQSP